MVTMMLSYASMAATPALLLPGPAIWSALPLVRSIFLGPGHWYATTTYPAEHGALLGLDLGTDGHVESEWFERDYMCQVLHGCGYLAAITSEVLQPQQCPRCCRKPHRYIQHLQYGW